MFIEVGTATGPRTLNKQHIVELWADLSGGTNIRMTNNHWITSTDRYEDLCIRMRVEL